MDVCAGMYMYNDVTLKWCAFVCTNDFSISFVWFLDSIVDVIRLFAVFCYWKSNSWALLNWNSTAWEYKIENGVCVFCFALCVNVCVCVCVCLWSDDSTIVHYLKTHCLETTKTTIKCTMLCINEVLLTRFLHTLEQHCISTPPPSMMYFNLNAIWSFNAK